MRKPQRNTNSSSSGVTLIGFGNWGTALAHALRQAGIPLREIVVRTMRPADRKLAVELQATLTTMPRAAFDAQVLWICTQDSAIRSTAATLARRLAITNNRPASQVIFHSSGALGSAEMSTLRSAGASLASVHPLMSFPARTLKVRSGQSLTNVPFAIEGDAHACHVSRKLVRAMGGKPFTVSGNNKALYHAFGAFASPLLTALLTATAEAGVAAGIGRNDAMRRMRPIVERTVQNFFLQGPGKSFSGPIPRGDVTILQRHLEALHSYPELAAIYRELARFALTSLPARRVVSLRRVLSSGKAASTGRSRASTA